MRRLILPILFLTARLLPATPLDLVQVAAPSINCVFDNDCKVFVTDTADHFTVGPATGDAFLQSRTFPPGEAGTPGDGLYAYLYRLDLRQLVGLTAIPCVTELSLELGTPVRLDYDSDGNLDDAFVVTSGGLGSTGPVTADRTGATITFTFSPAVCGGSFPGDGVSSYFFGLASSRSPREVQATIRTVEDETLLLDARAPQAGRFMALTRVRVDPSILRPQRERAWQDFQKRYGESWRVEWNADTGTPHLVTGSRIDLEEVVADERSAEAAARRLLREHASLLGTDDVELRLSKIDHQPSTAQGPGSWRVHFRQEHAGVPVLGGSARVTIQRGGVTSFGSDIYPGIAPLAVEPQIAMAKALAAVLRFDPRYEKTRPIDSRLVVAPSASSGGLEYRLAWELVMPVVKELRELVDPGTPRDRAGTHGERREESDTAVETKPEMVPAQWRYLVDAHSAAIIERENLMRYEDLSGTVTGPVHPEFPSDPPETREIPDQTVTVTQGILTSSGETDASGAYLVGGLAAGAVTLESHLEGPHLRVWNQETADPDATHSATPSAPGTHDWDWDADDPSTGNVETNAFWHTDWIRGWFLRGAPFDVSPLPHPMDVHVRDGAYCNASAGSSGLFFGHGTSTCEDFSLCSDILYHEYTHRIVHKVYDDASVSLPYSGQSGAMNEAWADYFGSTVTDGSMHGDGCYSGRDIAPDKRFPDDWVGEVHADGLIFSGALWDLRAALGNDYVDGLALGAMKEAATDFSDYVAAVLLWDDDPAYSTDPAADANPANGTPNIDLICHTYWDLHGIFHPACSGHTDDPIAEITDPSPLDFNLVDPATTMLSVSGTALGSSSGPLQSFVLEYAHESDTSTWLTAGVTLSGGGTTPVSAGSLGQIALSGLANGLYLVRLTVTDTGSGTATATSSFYLDHDLMTGWPQATATHFYGSPAVADIDPVFPGLEVVAAGFDNSVYVWHHDGTLAPGWPQAVSSTFSAPAVGDLDADGDLEIVLTDAYANVRAWHHDGTPVTGWPVSMPSASQAERSTTALGDLDGDGDLEVVVGSANAEIYAWHHDGTAVAGWPVATGDSVEASPALADLDGDGLPEVVVGSADGQMYVLDGSGTPLPGWPITVPGTPSITASAAVGDIDDDGDFEIVVGVEDTSAAFGGDHKIYAWHHDGSPVTGWPQDVTMFMRRPTSVDLADLDSDGDLEVLVQTNRNGLYAWHGDGSPLTGWPALGATGGYYEFTSSSPAAADIDGDGDIEVVAETRFLPVEGFDTYLVEALHHDASGVSGWPRSVDSYSNASPATADLDQDGDVEVLVGSDGIFVWDLSGAYDVDSAEWPLYRHDRLRTGRYGPKSAVSLLLDTSGSMGWRPDGSFPAPAAEQRITFAKQAASAFLELLNDFNEHRASFGIATFPAHPASFPWTCGAEVVTPMTVVSTASKTTAVTTTIPGLVTEDNTPLVAGMRTAAGMLGPEERTAVVLLSDGYHNCPTTLSVGDPEVTDLLSDLETRGVRVFTIGFGKPTDVDHPLLEALANGTTPASFPGSQFHDVTTPTFDPTSWDAATALQDTYKAVLVDALNLQTATDPLGTIGGGQTQTFPVHVTEHDRRVAAYLSWHTLEPRRLQLAVTAADGSAVPTSGPGVTVHHGQTYTILTVERSYLAKPGVVGAAPWKISVAAPGVPSGRSEPFQYSVIVDSSLRLRPGLGRRSYATGDTIRLTARLTAAGEPLLGLDDVEVRVVRPDQGLGDWLATHPVPRQELARVVERRGTERLAPVARKALFLEKVRHLPWPQPIAPVTLHLYDDGTHGDLHAGDGVYTNLYDDTAEAGTYSFHFRASGPTAGGNRFDRDARIQTRVEVAAQPEFSLVEVTAVANQPNLFTVTIVPRDRLGNLLGPGRAASLALVTSTGKLAGELRDNLDGSYTQDLRLPAGVPPAKARVQLEVRGETATYELAEKLRGKAATR